MLIGYMRVSSEHDRQTTDLQHDALIDAGVDPRHLFADKASGARNDRPGLQHALAYMRPGDCLVVWKLDRLGRSLSHLLHIVTTLQQQGVAFRSLTEQMDTTTPMANRCSPSSCARPVGAGTHPGAGHGPPGTGEGEADGPGR